MTHSNVNPKNQASLIAKEEPYRVEISVSIEPAGYLRELRHATFFALEKSEEGSLLVALPSLQCVPTRHENAEASVIGALADFAALCETRGALLGFEMPSEKAVLQAFDYLCVDEMSWKGRFRAQEENRQSHSWSLYRDQQGIFRVVYIHGKFGMREQTFLTLSSALYVLRDLVAGHPWLDFGDGQSRRSLMHKGQFYWGEPGGTAPIPVDNFVFETLSGHSWCIAESGGQSVLTWTSSTGRSAHVRSDDHCESLEELANILEGVTNAHAFHKEDVDAPVFSLAKGAMLSNEDRARFTAEFNAARWIPDEVLPVDLPVQGSIYVMNIFKNDDKFPVESLSYLTGQGPSVQLEIAAKSWTLTATNLDGQTVAETFGATQIHLAFRALAQLLRGNAWVERGTSL